MLGCAEPALFFPSNDLGFFMCMRMHSCSVAAHGLPALFCSALVTNIWHHQALWLAVVGDRLESNVHTSFERTCSKRFTFQRVEHVGFGSPQGQYVCCTMQQSLSSLSLRYSCTASEGGPAFRCDTIASHVWLSHVQGTLPYVGIAFCVFFTPPCSQPGCVTAERAVDVLPSRCLSARGFNHPALCRCVASPSWCPTRPQQIDACRLGWSFFGVRSHLT